MYWDGRCNSTIRDSLQMPWSESCRADGELVEARLSVTRSNSYNEAEALERHV